ncbi:MAG TPA: class I SAM-dependent methyltransferase [Acidobacteriota bacterium]|nr:class I SAM-dependent methyltransferase [Acidobacteriota bacterium]
MYVPSSFKELDNFLDRVDSTENDDQMRAQWNELKIDRRLLGGFPERLQATDPFSQEYTAEVLNFLDHLRGKQYGVSNEIVDIDIESMSAVCFPYSTRSPSTVGNFLMSYGFIIRSMDLPVPSKILDIGSGAGSLTVHLARMGYELTCVDVNPQYLELLKRMTEKLPNSVECICADMNNLELSEKFDAVLFMESFHHSLSHRATLRKVQHFLKRNGKIFFADEPVVEAEREILPYPWGPRLDGESIHAIRRHGWIEIGFTEHYFFNLLMRMGLSRKRLTLPEANWGDLIIAQPLLPLEFGAALSFSSKDRGIEFLGGGWSYPEHFGTWSCEDLATLGFKLDWPERKQSAVLKFSVRFFLARKHSSLEISIDVNGRNVDIWRVSGKAVKRLEKEVHLERAMIEHSSFVQIQFNVRSPASPQSLGISEDGRRLGLAVETLVVE